MVPAAYAIKNSGLRESTGSILVSLTVAITIWACFRLIRNEWVAAIIASLLAPLILGAAYAGFLGDASTTGTAGEAIQSMFETLTPVFLAWLLTLVWIATKTRSMILPVIGSLAVRAAVAIALPWIRWYFGRGTILMPQGPESALYGMIRHIGGAAVVTGWFWWFMLYAPYIIANAAQNRPKRNPAP